MKRLKLHQTVSQGISVIMIGFLLTACNLPGFSGEEEGNGNGSGGSSGGSSGSSELSESDLLVKEEGNLLTVYGGESLTLSRHGSFLSDANMRHQRKQHAALRLPDGNVMILGGSMSSALFGRATYASTEIYTIRSSAAQSDAFFYGPSLTKARNNPIVFGLADGRVFIFDQNASTLYNGGVRFERFETIPFVQKGCPSVITQPWNTKGVLVQSDGIEKVLLVSSGQAEYFNPQTECFETLSAPNTLRSGFSISRLASGQVLVVGGDRAGSAEIFDPETEEFATVAGLMSTTRFYHQSITLDNGQVLIHGGSRDGSIDLWHDTAEIFDPSNSIFTVIEKRPTRRWGATLTKLSSGKILIAGGNDESSGYYGLKLVEIYDPDLGDRGTFLSMGDALRNKRNYHTATLLEDGMVLICGGQPTGMRLCERYNPNQAGRLNYVLSSRAKGEVSVSRDPSIEHRAGIGGGAILIGPDANVDEITIEVDDEKEVIPVTWD